MILKHCLFLIILLANAGYIAQKTKSFVARLPPVDQRDIDDINQYSKELEHQQKEKLHITYLVQETKDQPFNSTNSHHAGTLSKMAYNTATELNAQRWYGSQVLHPITPSTANLQLRRRINDDYQNRYEDEFAKSSTSLYEPVMATDKTKKIPDDNNLLHAYLRGDAVQLER